jgi:hypothetical protein
MIIRDSIPNIQEEWSVNLIKKSFSGGDLKFKERRE